MTRDYINKQAVPYKLVQNHLDGWCLPPVEASHVLLLWAQLRAERGAVPTESKECAMPKPIGGISIKVRSGN